MRAPRAARAAANDRLQGGLGAVPRRESGPLDFRVRQAAFGVMTRVRGSRRNIRVVTVVGAMTPNLRDMKAQGGLASLTVGDRAICPRPLLRATQSVPRACIVDLKLASASASAQRRSCGVEHGIFVLGLYGALYTQNHENDVIFLNAQFNHRAHTSSALAA